MYSRTATQFDLMMKTIMIVLFVFGLFVFFADIAKADQWVNNPANCATQSPGGEVVCQTSETPDSRVCGVSGVQYYCFSSVAVFSAPGYTQNNNQNRSGLGGGYIMNCEANDGAPPSGPFCDNSTAFWCNSDVTCNNKFRTTQCSSSKWAYEANAFSCTDCISTRLDCSGDDVCEVIKNTTPSTTVPNTNYGNTCNTVVCQSGYGDCNSNLSDGCEIQFNVSTCTTGGGEPGVWTACGVCTALPPKYFLTASNTDYYSDNPLLWGTQLGTGDLISFSNATSSNIFVVKNDASVFMSSTLATTTEQYFYNYNGDLYWGDMKLGTGGGVTYTAGSGLNLAGYEFTIDTSTNFNWTGQHTFNTTTTFPLGVWGFNGKVGIGTTTPSFALSLVVDAYDGMTIYNTSSQMIAGIGSNPTGLSGGMGLFIAGTMTPAISFDASADSFINNNYNFGIGTDNPLANLSIKTDIAEYGVALFDGVDNLVVGLAADQLGNGALGIFNSSSTIFPAIVLNGANNSYSYVNSGNFGIGTISPLKKLSVKTSVVEDGIAVFDGNDNIVVGFGADQSGSGALGIFDTGVPTIILNGTGDSFINSGKFGIGTTTPQFKLSVKTDDVEDGIVIFDGNDDIVIGFGADQTGSGALVIGDTGIPTITLNGAGNSFINSGKFGIGTTTPQYALTLAGDFDIAKNGLLRFNGISGSVDQVIKINSSGFPEWVDVNSLFINNTTFNSTSTFNSSTEFNSTSTFNSTAIFEGPSYFNNDVFVSGTISSTNLYVNGNSTTTGDLYVLGQAIFHDILPADNLTYTVGTSSLVWKEGWFGKIFTPEIDFTNNWKLSTTTDGGLAFTSSTQVALAMLSTGQVGINTTTIEANLKMKVDGNIGSRMYCDINGENCFDPIFGWAHPQATYSTTTPAMFQGNLNTSTLVGYQAGDNICQYYFGNEYYMCSTEDVFNIIHTQDLTQFIVNDSEGWVANGPPGYVANSNDCAGWTASSSLYYGAYWSFNQNGGGQGKLTTCNLTRPISCCK